MNLGKELAQGINNIKTIYSLNLSAYIAMKTGKRPLLHYNFDANRCASKWFCIFVDDDSCGVQKAFDDFRDKSKPLNVDLHLFLTSLKDIVDRKNHIQEDINEWNSQ